jgi:hypothetical protein
MRIDDGSGGLDEVWRVKFLVRGEFCASHRPLHTLHTFHTFHTFHYQIK